MKKPLSTITFIIVALAVGWCAERLFTLEDRIQSHLEKTMTQLVGVPVNIENVELSVLSGEGSVTGLTVANPPGYSADSAFKMTEIAFDLDIISAITRPLRISHLLIDSPRVNLEVKEAFNSNLKDIVSISQSRQSSPLENTGEVGAENSVTQGESNSYPIAIEKLEIRNLQFKVSRGNDNWEGSLELIEMHNLGGGQGMSAGDLSYLVLKKITTDVLAQAVSDKLSEKVKNTVKKLKKSLLDSLLNQ